MLPPDSRLMRLIQQPLAGRRLVVLTVLLGGFTAFGPLSMDLYLPAFPELAADLGVSQTAVQLTLTADVIGLVVGQLVLGPLSDARGRRWLLIDPGLRDGVGAVRAGAVGGLAHRVALPAGRVRGRRDRAGPRGGRRHCQRGGGGPAVLAVHDLVKRRAHRGPGARWCAAGRDGELAPDVLAAGRDQPGARRRHLAGHPGNAATRAPARGRPAPDRPRLC